MHSLLEPCLMRSSTEKHAYEQLGFFILPKILGEYQNLVTERWKRDQMNIRKREMQASLIIMISAIIIKNITESNIS